MKRHRSSWHRDLRREWELGWFLSVADLTFLTESSWLWGGLRRVVLGNTHAWHPALFSLWTCVKMSDCTPSNVTQLPHRAVRNMRRLIIGNCLFRRRGQVLRKSSIPWRFFFFLDSASQGFFAPLFCRTDETKPTGKHSERPTLVCGSYLARRKRSEEQILKERGLHGCHLSGRLCQWKSSLVCS